MSLSHPSIPEPRDPAIDVRHPESGWTTERVELIKLRQSQGLSARDIAAEIGLSRSAVIGKLARLGLTGKYKRSAERDANGWLRKAQIPRNRTPRAPRTIQSAAADGNLTKRISRRVANSSARRQARIAEAAEMRAQFACTEIVDLSPEESKTFCTIMELSDVTCRWPIGSPGAPGFGYCGAQVDGDRVYCRGHWVRAHQRRDET